MLRKTFPYVRGLAFVAGLATGPAVTAAAAADTVMHSGVVTAVDPARGTLTLDEYGPWKGPDTKPMPVSIALQPTTSVDLVQRSTLGNGRESEWPGGYTDSPMKPADIRAGAFANVSTVRHGDQLVAVSIDVVTPSND